MLFCRTHMYLQIKTLFQENLSRIKQLSSKVRKKSAFHYGARVTLIKIKISQQRIHLTCVGQCFYVAQISTIEWHTKLRKSIEIERDILVLRASLERHSKIIFDLIV